jgi:hypothetical protein
MSNGRVRPSAAGQCPCHCHSVPLRGLHEIEFFSDLVNEVITISQVKEITSHASPTAPTPRRVAPRDEPGLAHNAAAKRVMTNRPTHGVARSCNNRCTILFVPHVGAHPGRKSAAIQSARPTSASVSPVRAPIRAWEFEGSGSCRSDFAGSARGLDVRRSDIT